jgi:hypothetical protein
MGSSIYDSANFQTFFTPPPVHSRLIAVYNKHEYHIEVNTNVSNTDHYEQVTTKENRENTHKQEFSYIPQRGYTPGLWQTLPAIIHP